MSYFQVGVLKRVLEEVEKVMHEFKSMLYKSMEDPQIDLTNVSLFCTLAFFECVSHAELEAIKLEITEAFYLCLDIICSDYILKLKFLDY